MKIKESSLMSCIAVYIIILLNVQLLFAHRVPHVHRNQNKRQSASLISFGVEEKQPSETSDYYFEVFSPSVDLVCTIKHYDLGLRVTLYKDTPSGSSNEAKSVELINPTDAYKVNEALLNDDLYKGRFVSNYSFTYDTSINAITYKAIFKIKNASLVDNGKYRCVYGNLDKKINVVVYKKLTDDDISIVIKDKNTNKDVPISNSKAVLTMNGSYDFICQAAGQYPNSTVEMLLNNKKLTDQTEEDSQLIRSDTYVYDLHTIKSTLDVVATNKENNNELSCTVYPTVPSLESKKKIITLEVHGIHFIDDQCSQDVKVKIGDKDVKISCLYYANPDASSQWLYKKPAAVETDSENKEITNEAVDGGEIDLNSSGSGNSDNELNVIENDDSYTLSSETGEDHLFRTNLIIKQIQSEKDLKKYIIRIDTANSPITREIQLSVYGENDVPALKFESKGGAGGGSNSCTSLYERSLFHSILLTIAFIIIKNYLN